MRMLGRCGMQHFFARFCQADMKLNVRPIALVLVIVGAAFSSPAVACLCSCSMFSSHEKKTTVTEVPADYREIFSGLVIATERIDEPVAVIASSGTGVMVDPGYWIKSKV